MSEPVSLEEIKLHLRLEAEDTDEDGYLESMIVAARRSVEAQTSRPISGTDGVAGDDLETVKQAIRLIVGHWYMSREAVVVGQQVTELPMAVTWLLAPLRKWET